MSSDINRVEIGQSKDECIVEVEGSSSLCVGNVEKPVCWPSSIPNYAIDKLERVHFARGDISSEVNQSRMKYPALTQFVMSTLINFVAINLGVSPIT